MKLNKVVNFFKSKSVVDFVYLVMMILIVTMIKDMIVSMYKKRKDKQWLNQAFGKTKGGKNVEGFVGGMGGYAVGDSVSGSGSGSGSGSTYTSCTNCPTCPQTTGTICDRLKFLLCDEKFHILKKYIDADWVNKSGNSYRLNTKGANVYTMGGGIYTNKLRTGGRHTDNETPIEFNSLNFNPTSGQEGGKVSTGGGDIRSYGGDISTKRYVTTNVGSNWTYANAGDIYGGDGILHIEYIYPRESKLKTKENNRKVYVSTHDEWFH